MSRHDCFRKGCTRIRTEFSLFLNRRRPPMFEGHSFCGETCLRKHVREEIIQRWKRLQNERERRIPRPRLGTILMQTAFVTRHQLDEAVRHQQESREGRLGEWLLRLGFVEERQVTMALSRQFGIPLIDLKHCQADDNALRMIPPMVAKCADLLPVSYDSGNGSLRVAVSGPVNFIEQEALRRMIGTGISVYIGDQSAIRSLRTAWYEPESLDLSRAPYFQTLDELLDIVTEAVGSAVQGRATGIRVELMNRYLWIRVDSGSSARHAFYRHVSTPESGAEIRPELDYAVASRAAS